MILKIFSIAITFILFLIQFKYQNEWNSEINDLQFAGIRHEISVNNNNMNKLMFQVNDNPFFLVNGATELTTSLIRIMVLVGLSKSEQEKYLKGLERFSNNVLNSTSAYEEFEREYSKIREKFNKEVYEPKIERIHRQKNLASNAVIVITLILMAINIAVEIKTKANKI